MFSDRIHSPELRTQLISLTNKSKPTIGYISSAPDPGREFYHRSQEYYAQMGANLTPYFDLELGFDRSSLKTVFAADAIHLSGGNTYRFYYWILQRGLHPMLLDYANSGRVIAGFSAGAIILTPDISYSQLCGDRNDIGLENLGGLGLVDFCFVPHVDRGDEIVPAIIEKSWQDNSRIIVASDLDWIVVNGYEIKTYGDPMSIAGGELLR